jgi:hypothetical protein
MAGSRITILYVSALVLVGCDQDNGDPKALVKAPQSVDRERPPVPPEAASVTSTAEENKTPDKPPEKELSAKERDQKLRLDYLDKHPNTNPEIRLAILNSSSSERYFIKDMRVAEVKAVLGLEAVQSDFRLGNEGDVPNGHVELWVLKNPRDPVNPYYSFVFMNGKLLKYKAR